MDLHPASGLLHFDVLKKKKKKLGMNRLRSLLSMRSVSLEYSFEPRPKSRALCTAGSVMTLGLTRENKID